MPDSTRIAIVGAGRMAEAHLRAFLAQPGVVCAGIYSRTTARAAALAHRYGALPVYTSLSELYAYGQPHGAVLAVSCPDLADVTQAAMAYNWTILMEKPPGLTPADTQRLLAVQKQYGRRVFVGLNRRCMGVMRQARTVLAQAGGVQSLHVQDTQDLTLARQYGEPEVVLRHWMYANAIHTIDLFRYLGGAVSAVRVIRPWQASRPETVVAILQFTSGATGLYEGYWNAPGPWAVTATAPGIRCELRPLEKLLLWRTGEQPVEVAVPTEDVRYKPGLYAQAAAFVQALHPATAASCDLADLAEAWHTMRLISLIYGPSREETTW
jgi:predicted dehydrogenase